MVFKGGLPFVVMLPLWHLRGAVTPEKILNFHKNFGSKKRLGSQCERLHSSRGS